MRGGKERERKARQGKAVDHALAEREQSSQEAEGGPRVSPLFGVASGQVAGD